jgi:hypothetical protein
MRRHIGLMAARLPPDDARARQFLFAAPDYAVARAIAELYTPQERGRGQAIRTM